MTPAEWKRVLRPLVDERWEVKGRLGYVRPTDEDQVLRGVFAERSSGDGSYLWQVRLPLYGPPCEVVDLSWSDRVGGASQTYTATDPQTEVVVRGAVNCAALEASVDGLLVDPPGGADNAAMQEVRGYGLLLGGDTAGAVECLGRVERSEIRSDWQRELVARAAEMRLLLNAGRSDEVVDQIYGWRAESLANLGIKSA